MEKFVTKQLDLFKRIRSTVDNMKKMGAAKITKGVLTSRLDLLEKNWSSFAETHNELLDVFAKSEVENPYFKQDYIGLCEESYVQQKAILLDLLDDITAGKPVPSQNATSLRSLPKIILPTFAGDYQSWSNFRDLFQSLIIDNQSLSLVEKLHYLKTSLTGEPALLLQNVSVTGDNFERAWSTINDRYQNLRVLIYSQLTSLTSQPSIKRESSRELKGLLNGTTDAVQALEALKRPVKFWDDWLVFITADKLDPKTRMAWETSLGSTAEPPTFAQLRDFLTARIRALEAVEGSSGSATTSSGAAGTQRQEKRTPVNSTLNFKAHATSTKGDASRRCPICKKDHFILFCPTYKGMNPRERKHLVTERRLCFNCLAPHSSFACKSSKRCQICIGKHHTSLHSSFESSTDANISSSSQVPESNCNSANSLQVEQPTEVNGKVTHCTMTSCSVASSISILLATAELVLESDQGKRVIVRALIDPCSEISLVEESVAQLLELPRAPERIPVIGVGKNQTYTKGRVSLQLFSRVDSSVSYRLTAYVLPRLSSYRAAKTSCPSTLNHLEGIQLADPNFQSQRRINVILGADIYVQIIRAGLIQGPPETPIAQATSLGWILTGPLRQSQNLNEKPNCAISLQCSIRESSLVETLTRFWKLEDVALSSDTLTEEEKLCEDHFLRTHKRDESGKYVVRLPFKSSLAKLGESKGAASKLLCKLEHRFKSDINLQTAYREFLKEYEELGHMERIPEPTSNPDISYYLPHHGVMREASSTTKLRVVFNASHKTTTGFSLNELLHAGPNLLPEIFTLLLRWRKHVFVFSADIEKMYRQIWVAREDCDLQRIVWRDNPEELQGSYRLLTVTYGMACAPFLAIRTLLQLSRDEEKTYPLAAHCLRNDVYVDDVVSGSDTLEEAALLQEQLLELLKAGGFKLRKWASNTPELLNKLPPDFLASSSNLSCNFDGVSSLLGMKWNTTSDCFLFSVRPRRAKGSVTKRVVFSEIAGLFDPLGLLAPVVTMAKIFMQSLWLSNVTWDDPLHEQQAHFWEDYYSKLSALADLKIPRWISVIQNLNRYELHGFADSSEKAYAAVVYVRVIPDQVGSECSVNLVAAKTRVAPLKQVSLPRLELCAATLLARLISKIKSILNLPNCTLHLWSDSSIVLSWLQQHPTKWKTFVANRVSEIQTTVPEATWRHIRSVENPADAASRGLSAEKLELCNLWWHGPSFLKRPHHNLDQYLLANLATEQEARAVKVVCSTVAGTSWFDEFVNKYSSINKLCKITAWCLRFRKANRKTTRTIEPYYNYISARELHNARLTLIRCLQSLVFAHEKALLVQGASISRGPLSHLNPFLDETEVIRVGGRLKHSLLDFHEKHPIVLPARGHITVLIIRDAHHKTLHGGTQLTLGTIRQRYWILCGRRAVRTVIHSCITCVRWRAKTAQQQMADLPSTRVRPTRPFYNTGVDYAGPFLTKASAGRGIRTRKCYVAVFVCLSTRAVHLELVSDYTTNTFLAAYRRFVSRRGLCSMLVSDQGTNFIGAARELRQLFKAANFEWGKVIDVLALQGTTWKFNPPAAPHFGGIWEAVVKSMKFHLRRVVGDTALSFEEMTTILSQIEACLNSRPLAPLGDDSDSFNFLTPGHFLIGAPLLAVPEPSLVDEQLPRLSRWKMLQQMRDHFWKRWAAEYLQQLQARGKWCKPQPKVKTGDLCFVTSEITPPTKWPIGRIEATYPGDDNRVRVVLVRTPHSTVKRPITKICPFPASDTI